MIVQFLLFCLPWVFRRRLLVGIYGYQIAPTASIGFSIIRARQLQMAAGARIGHLTMIGRLNIVMLGKDATLGNLNWIGGMPTGGWAHFQEETCRDPSLIIEDQAAITHRHLIDCTDKVTIGAFSTFAGWGSQILTHAIDLKTCRQSCAPVTIGRYAFIGTRSVILKGVSFPDRSVLAAGAVLSKTFTETDCIYGGSPVSFIRNIEKDEKYFSRNVGFIY